MVSSGMESCKQGLDLIEEGNEGIERNWGKHGDLVDKT